MTGGTATTINLSSDYGTVSINNISFPRVQQSQGLDIGLTAAGDGRVLSWDNGKLTWSDITFNASSYIGTTGKIKQPQLHFAVREGKNAVDPLKFVNYNKN